MSINPVCYREVEKQQKNLPSISIFMRMLLVRDNNMISSHDFEDKKGTFSGLQHYGVIEINLGRKL